MKINEKHIGITILAISLIPLIFAIATRDHLDSANSAISGWGMLIGILLLCIHGTKEDKKRIKK